MTGLVGRIAAVMVLTVLLMSMIAACSTGHGDGSTDTASNQEVQAVQANELQAAENAGDEAATNDDAASAEEAEASENAAAEESGQPEASDDEAADAVMQGDGSVLMRAGDAEFTLVLEDNEAAQELFVHVEDGPLALDLREYGGFEKVGPLPWSLPADDVSMTTEPGDVVLYQGNQISVMYGSNSWSYTKLGHIEGAAAEDLAEALGSDDVTIELSLVVS